MEIYYKWTDKGELICVDEDNHRFKYITPGPEIRRKAQYSTLDRVFDLLEDQQRFAPWTTYD